MVQIGHRKSLKKRPLQKQDNRKKARIGGNAMASNPTAPLGAAALAVGRKLDRWESRLGWARPGCPLSKPEVRGWPVKGMEAGWPAGEADQQGQSALVQLEQERAREWSWPVEDADQQSRLHLVGASGTGRGTHASSVAGPSHQGDTSVSQELCKEERPVQ